MLYRISGHNIATEPPANDANMWIVPATRVFRIREGTSYT